MKELRREIRLYLVSVLILWAWRILPKDKRSVDKIKWFAEMPLDPIEFHNPDIK